jgi:hypothetical protein
MQGVLLIQDKSKKEIDMRELTIIEVEEVSGGNDYVDAVGTGSAIGSTFYGGVVAAAGYSTSMVVAAFLYGGAVGGLAGGFGYLAYQGATMAGAGSVGNTLGSWLANRCE